MNILITSVGRRGYLVDYFREEIGISGKVIVLNSTALASGMVAGDESFVVSRVDSPEYISNVLKICKEKNIKALISLFDIDLPYLAAARGDFEEAGVHLVLSDSWVIDVANDKWKTYTFLKDQGFKVPETVCDLRGAHNALEMGLLSFPLIVKPRWGMGSLSVFKAETVEELDFFYNYSLKFIRSSYLNILSDHDMPASIVVQQFISGTEYGLDVYNDLNSEYVVTVPKQKMAMRSGETDIAMSVEDPALERLGAQLSACLRHRGDIDVDVLRDKRGVEYILEINARFGGGYPFSHAFGANIVRSLVAELRGEYSKISQPEPGRIAMKNIGITLIGSKL